MFTKTDPINISAVAKPSLVKTGASKAVKGVKSVVFVDTSRFTFRFKLSDTWTPPSKPMKRDQLTSGQNMGV